MLIDYGVSVKYTKETTNVTNYDTGLTDWQDIESFYRGYSFREKVICKIDATYYLEKYFKPETIQKYRPVLMMLANNQVTDPKQFSNVIKEFIEMDSTFANAIVTLFQSCPEDNIFGYYIIQCLADTLKNAETDYRNFFRGKPQVVICLSNGYIYFSVSDTNQKHSLPSDVNCEVISYGKNWKGDFVSVK